jgi:hypothetical protein
LAKSLQDLYEQYGLTKKILAYVKYEVANPNTMMYSCFEQVANILKKKHL